MKLGNLTMDSLYRLLDVLSEDPELMEDLGMSMEDTFRLASLADNLEVTLYGTE